VPRTFADVDRLRAVVGAALGTSNSLASVERLRGGSKKGVYRLVFKNESTLVLYAWSPNEDYWPREAHPGADDGDPRDPFSDASSPDLFEASHALLLELGVRVPALYVIDRTRSHYDADVALVEDIRGGTLEKLIEHDLEESENALDSLRATFDRMHRHQAAKIGKVTVAKHGDGDHGDRPEDVVLAQALRHLDEAAARAPRIAGARNEIEHVARSLADGLQARPTYSLIHGELGPDHVLVDDEGGAVLIDIEGVMFFDVEWEDAFIRMRFRDQARRLETAGLDEQRMRFYTLALHLSLIAGPLKLVDGDIPERDEYLEIAEAHTNRALSFVR
jgi:hypothetical protein